MGKLLLLAILAAVAWFWWRGKNQRLQRQENRPLDDAARLLGVAPQADADAIRAAWRRQVAAHRGRHVQQHPHDGDQFLAQLGPLGHPVQHAVIQQVFGALKAFGQLFADRLFDHPWPGKADQRIGLGDVNVAQHRI